MVKDFTYQDFELLDITDSEGDCIATRDWDIQCKLVKKNDGIGHYEFWGSSGYDAGTDYYELMEVSWERSEYTEQENQALDKWVEDNWTSIEEDVITGGDVW